MVTGIFNLIKTRIDYKNDYYKLLLNNRLSSLQLISNILYWISVTCIDESDGKPYYIIFHKNGNQAVDKIELEFYSSIAKLSISNIWISKKVRKEITELNRYLISNKIRFNNIEDGKKHYQKLAELRDNILVQTKKELLKLHNIRKLLKEEIKTEFKEFHYN